MAADFVGTMIAFVCVTFLFFVLRGASGQPFQTALRTITKDPFFLVVGYISGLVSTLLAAYIVAHMSRPHSVLNTLLFGIVSTLLIVSFGPNLHWYNVLGAFAIIPVSLLPGYLLARQRSNHALQPTAGRSDI
jgi:hypothetical protein